MKRFRDRRQTSRQILSRNFHDKTREYRGSAVGDGFAAYCVYTLNRTVLYTEE